MSKPLPDLTGRKVGEYEITALLGSGGMGAVYEGRHPVIGKRVAVKVLLPKREDDETLVQRFVVEARAVNEIRHRGIVDIFGFGRLEDTGAHYFVMELLEGLAFNKYLRQFGPLHPAEALWWTEEMCDALSAAHNAGIVHRDIKPQNLFIVDTGRGQPYLKILDFGIAKLNGAFASGGEQARTQTGMVIGTPEYISPEQATGEPITPKTDLYAVGCVLYEMLAGRRPFIGDSALKTMAMHVSMAPQPPSTHSPRVPPGIDALVLQTLGKYPHDRPGSADELRTECARLRLDLERDGPVPFAIAPGRGRPMPPPGNAQSAPPKKAFPTAQTTEPVSVPPVHLVKKDTDVNPPHRPRSRDTLDDTLPVREPSRKSNPPRRVSPSSDSGNDLGESRRRSAKKKTAAKKRSFRVVWLSLALLGTMLGAFAYWFPSQAFALWVRLPWPAAVARLWVPSPHGAAVESAQGAGAPSPKSPKAPAAAPKHEAAPPPVH